MKEVNLPLNLDVISFVHSPKPRSQVRIIGLKEEIAKMEMEYKMGTLKQLQLFKVS